MVMKNMIDYLKVGFWEWLITAIIVLVVSLAIDRCSSSSQTVLTQNEVSAKLVKQKYELEKRYQIMLIDSSKVIQAYAKRISDGLKPKIRWKTRYAQQAVAAARADTATTALCDSAINAQESLIFDLGLKAIQDSTQLAESERQSAIKATMLLKSDSTINDITRINENLANQLRRKNNWFDRNKLWLGIGAGFVGGALLMK